MGTQGWQRDNPSQRQRPQAPQPGADAPAGGTGGGFMGLGGGQKPTPGKVLNFMFNPELGKSISPLKQAGSMFTRILALVFSQHGLFPRNHPALIDKTGQTRLGLGEVIGTAWQTLRWEKDNIPQIFFFVSILGFLVFGALTLLAMLAGLFVGNAHAEGGGGGGGFFSFASADQSKQIIDYLFFAQGSSDFPNNPGLQAAVGNMFAFYSNAMLVFAAFILMYILVSMVAETAHHGVAFGKRASQIWAPVRLVVAIGMLVPIGSVGLSSGQLIVIQVTSWGAGLASQVWNVAIEGMRNSNLQMRGPDPVLGYGAMIRGMVENYACWHAYNIALERGAAGGGFSSDVFRESQISERATLTGLGKIFGNEQITGFQLCGGYEMPANPAGAGSGNAAGAAVEAYMNASRNAFNGSLGLGGSFGQLAKKIVESVHPDIPQNERPPQPSPGEFTSLVINYRTQLEQATAQAFQAQQADMMSALLDDAAAKGWIAAGRFLYDIAVTQNTILDVSSQALPRAIKAKLTPDLIDQGADAVANTAHDAWTWVSRQFGYEGEYSQVSPFIQLTTKVVSINSSVQTWLSGASTIGPSNNAGQNITDAGGAIVGAGEWLIDNAGNIASGVISELGDLVSDFDGYVTGKGMAAGFAVFDTVLWFFEKAYTYAGVWNDKGELGVQVNAQSTNPMLELITLGQKWVRGNMGIAGIGMLCSAIPICPNQAAGALIFLGLLGMIPGIFIAFLLPLIPFIKFFFTALTWVVSVFEAVLMVPIMAIAHLNPEGEGLPGQWAQNAYLLILSVFLRPVLMVFGLVSGLLIFGISMAIINSLFLGSATATGAAGIGSSTLSRIIFTVIYMVLAYTAANSAFKAIDFFPQQALQWLGGRQAITQRMGDPGTMQQVLGGAGAIATFKATETFNQIAQRGAVPIAAAPSGGGGGGKGGGGDTGGTRRGAGRNSDEAAVAEQREAATRGGTASNPKDG
jgi:hypothetical protein